MRFAVPWMLILTLSSSATAVAAARALPQSIDDRIISEHIRLRLPTERQWLGRDTIVELERGYKFMNSATGERMPRRILVDVVWDQSESRTEAQDARLTIGMNHPAADANMRGFLLHAALREMARLGLLSLSKGGAPREESEFLIEGMSEILAHEYQRSIRRLGSAWAMAQLLDRMGQLGFAAQFPWSSFSGGRRDLRAAAPGITFLLTCRETYGREKTLKLFEILHRGGLEESLAATFRTNARELEKTWLDKVRSFALPEDSIAGSDEDAPRLEKTAYAPLPARPGTTLQVRLFIRAGSNALLPSGLYLQEEASGKVIGSQLPGERGAGYFLVPVPIEAERAPGPYNYRVLAIDEGWTVRVWQGSYLVER